VNKVSGIWLTIEEVISLTGEIKETVRRKCKNKKYTSKYVQNGKYKIYSVLLSSLPEDAQNKYLQVEKQDEKIQIEKIENNLNCYANAPLWAQKQADKYLEIIKATENMTYSQINSFLEIWNKNFPEKTCSYTALYRAKKAFEEYGVEALLSKKNNCKKLKLNPEYFEYYKSLYLREGAPSANYCWMATLGFAKQTDNINITGFPTCRSFDRELKRTVPEQAIYLARFGQAAWNKKYAKYISRDYSNIVAGAFWVSDHAQIDVAVSFNGNVCFPWVTVFRDIKSSKWLGWFLHADSPNSDHIFQAFYYGVQKYGLPSDVYLDNGKDYRCKDFAGGRNSTKVLHSSKKENSLLSNINVNVHFALPYNAQTKPVERDFMKIKTFLSKGFVGYRGGKITERPEKLKDEIKADKIMDFQEFKLLFDDFIENVLNKMPSKGKVLQGRCPDEVWEEEFKTKKVISRDALKLFCMRTSNNVSIGRNGIRDSQFDITYWAEWMITEKGRKVFIRRDINAYQEAWVFDAKTEKFLGKAFAAQTVPFMATTNIEKAQFKNAIEIKRKEKKVLQGYLKTKYNPTNTEIIANLSNSIEKKDFTSKPQISRISNTKMDIIVQEEKKNNLHFEKYVTPLKPKKKLYMTESEKRRDLEQQAM